MTITSPPDEKYHRHLEDLARLPTTESLLERLQTLQTQPDTPQWPPGRKEADLKWTLSRIELAKERDAIIASRPKGCLCLGLGYFNSHFNQATGKLQDVLCPCSAGQEEALRREKKKNQERLVKIEMLWENAEIPSRFWSYSFASSPILKTQTNLGKTLSSTCTSDLWPSPSWYFWGNFGVGKTGLAIAYARAYLESCPDTSILFRTLPRLLSELRSTYNRKPHDDTPSEESFLERYRSVDLLILDDLGAEQVSGSGWLQDRLYQIIGERHDEERPIIFTSNLNLDDMAAKIGERLIWRILEMCGEERIIHLIGPNLRTSSKPKPPLAP